MSAYERRTWLAGSVYALVLFGLGADKYLTYRAGADVGLFTQSISSVFHGFANTMEGGSHFTFHFSPILYACAPLLLVWHSPLALVALQALAGGLTAPPLFLIARKRVPESLAFSLACVGLWYPPLVGLTFSDFHENGFAPAAILWLLWAVDARRWVAAWFCLFTALSVKEDQSLFLAFASVAAFWAFARRGDITGMRFSCAAGALALTVFIAFFAVVRPFAGAVGPWQPLHFYGLAQVEDPKAIASAWSFGKFAYVLEACAPLLFFNFRSWWMLLAVPAFAEILCSQRSLVWTMGQHYAGAWIGFVLAAFVMGVAALHERAPRRAVTCVRACGAICVLMVLFASPAHWGHFLALRTPHDAVLDRVLAGLPPDMEVGTQDETFAHLGFDPRASVGLTRDPPYVLLDRTFTSSYWVEKTEPEMQREVRMGAARPMMKEDGVVLYVRKRNRV